MSLFSSHHSETVYVETPNPNVPDPGRFEITSIIEIGKYLIVKAKYAGAKSFEGKKILVFKDLTKAELLKIRKLDPHFIDSKEAPVARFRPTQEGLMNAIAFVTAVSEGVL